MQTPFEVLNIGADVAKDEIVVACSEGSFLVRRAFDDERCGEGRQTPDIVGQSRASPPFSAHISTLYIPLLVGTLSLVVLACKWRTSATVTTETRN